ncbi:MAG: hypothetical protein AB1592_11415 [Pseudomonadota bacterium]
MTRQAHPNSHAARLKLAEEALTTMRSKLSSAQDTIEALEARNEQLEARCVDADKQVATARDTMTHANQQLDQHEGTIRSLSKEVDQHYRRAVKAKEGEAAARKSIEDLKHRLMNAEIEAARLRGYIERVAEDDKAREEPVQVATTHMVPRRNPPPLFGDGSAVMNAPSGTGAFGSRMHADGASRPKHWTGF